VVENTTEVHRPGSRISCKALINHLSELTSESTRGEVCTRAGSDRLNWAAAETSVHENPNREYSETSLLIVSTDGRKDGDIKRYVRTPQAAFYEPVTAL
jgi:hypothetical protein